LVSFLTAINKGRYENPGTTSCRDGRRDLGHLTLPNG
jgi:hypothetical protein